MMKCCKCFAPLLGLAFVLGMANTALGLGACANPADGTTCETDESQASCEANWGGTGVWQGEGTTGCRDCDCDGVDDAKVVQDCVDLCMNPGGGSEAACLAVCSDNAAYDGKPLTCPSTNQDVPSADWCCNQADGSKLDYTDGIACTDDVCHADGSVSNPPNHSICEGLYPTPPECHVVECVLTTGDGCAYVDGPAGVDCGDAALGVCDLQDTCDDSGNCVDNREPTTTECRADDGSGCDIAENCAGGRHCPTDAKQLPGTDCGAPPSGDCDAQDTCGSGGNLGVCMPRYKASTVICRPATGVCDKNEYCDGVSDTCPPDLFRSSTYTCGNPDGFSDICDKQDTCDGAGACVNHVWPAGTPCRGDTGECDEADVCDGVTDVCEDTKSPAGTACGSAADTTCDNPDTCNTSGVCKDRNEPDGTSCDTTPDNCLDASCLAGACTVQTQKAEFTPCDGPPTGQPCDLQDTCDSAGVCVDRLEAAGTECRPSVGECDAAELCSGTYKACPAEVQTAMNGMACTDDTNECTNDFCWYNVCAHPNYPDSTQQCDDGDVCTTVDWCSAGACYGTTPMDCSDGVYCTWDLCDSVTGCYNPYSNPAAVNGCGDLLVMAGATGSGPISTLYEDQCFSVEIWVTDASMANDGITCAYVDVRLGNASCPLVVDGWTMGADFPENQAGYSNPEPNGWWVNDLGGCTVASGVGAGGYVLLATLDVVAPQIACTGAPIVVAQAAMTKSSLVGQGEVPASVDPATIASIDTICWGNLYNHSDSSVYINAGDLSMFATGWMTADPTYDYDCDGAVGPGDLSLLASAWLKDVCAGGILIDECQLNCGGPAAMMQDEDGILIRVDTPAWASDEMIKSFGLTVPPEDWEGWRLAPQDRVTPKDNMRSGVRDR